MKFWQMLTWMEPEQVLEVSRFAEDLGFEGVMLGDHGVFPRDVKTPYPYSRDGKPPMAPDAWYPDCWATIGAISGPRHRHAGDPQQQPLHPRGGYRLDEG